LPDLVAVELKEDKVPTSYANAFAAPAKTGYRKDGFVGLAEDSVEKLAREIELMEKAYGLEVKHRAWFSPRYPVTVPKVKTVDALDSFQELKTLLTAWGKGEELP
jgi:hypothetical protein